MWDVHEYLHHMNALTWAREARRRSEPMGEYAKQIGVSTFITWIITGLAVVMFWMVQGAVARVDTTLIRLDDKINGHMIDHPNENLTERVAKLEARAE